MQSSKMLPYPKLVPTSSSVAKENRGGRVDLKPFVISSASFVKPLRFKEKEIVVVASSARNKDRFGIVKLQIGRAHV